MNAFLLKNRIHDYIDGELTADERREFESALVDHPDLIEEIETLQQQRNSMLELGQVQAPEHLLANILAEVETVPTAANQPRGVQYTPFILAAAVVLFAWIAIPSVRNEHTTMPANVKGAQLILPTVNAIQLPETSPIEEANKHLEELSSKSETKPTSSLPKSTPSPSASPKQKTKQQRNPTFVIKTPDTPYVAEWEDGHLIEVSQNTFAPDAFQFRKAPAKLLFTLEKLATAYNGQLKSSNGEAFSTVELTNFSPRAKCELWVPTEHVAIVNQKLTEMGGQFFDETIQQSNGFAIFKIDARYEYY